jgi:predicted RNase H-like HicB family nuclease
MRYLVVIEATRTGYSAYAPDLPGCVSTGATPGQVEANMRKAIDLHLRGLRVEGYDVPPPQSTAVYLEVATPLSTGRRVAEARTRPPG